MASTVPPPTECRFAMNRRSGSTSDKNLPKAHGKHRRQDGCSLNLEDDDATVEKAHREPPSRRPGRPPGASVEANAASMIWFPSGGFPSHRAAASGQHKRAKENLI